MSPIKKPYIRPSGTYVRVKTYSGKVQPTKYRYDDVGEVGHTQRIAAFHKSKGWFTYGWIFKKLDVKNRRAKTMTLLRTIGVKEADIKRLGL